MERPPGHAWNPTRIAAAAVLLAGLVGLSLGWSPRARGVPDEVRIPMRVPRGAGDFPPDAARFSHWGHRRAQCYDCHPSVFPQARLAFDHAAMDKGRYCGACHGGDRARAIDDMDCEACHAPPR